jgi:hypothetical protein
MTVNCSECLDNVLNPGILIVPAIKETRSIRQGSDFLACRKHLKKRQRPIHPLNEVRKGPIFIIKEVRYPGKIGSPIQFAQNPEEERILGYATPHEAFNYFPRTYETLLIIPPDK